MSINESMIIARSGILTHAQRLGVISHNIANVNTDGYHRQTVLLGTNPPIQPTMLSTTPYDEGTGVRIVDVVRSYNHLQETMLLQQNSSAEYHSEKAAALSDIEGLLAGTGDATLDARLQEYWNAWQDVANNPESMAYRNVLIQRGASLTDHINMVYDRLNTFRNLSAAGVGPNFTGVVADEVDSINSLATRIADLNYRITRTEVAYDPNDLRDKRNVLIRELSEKVNITVADDFGITIDGEILVNADGSTRNELTITTVSNGVAPAVQLSLDGSTVVPTGGSLGAWMDIVDITDSMMANLDTMANTLIADVNALHTAGYDLAGNAGIDFFTGAGAGGITVNALIHDTSNPLNDNPELIAAAATLHAAGVPNTGDGANALLIAQLVYNKSAALGNQSYSEYWNGNLSALGATIKSESDLAEDGKAVINMLSDAIQNETGVNLDEEMISMIEAQRAYQASSKVFTILDEMLDFIINGLKR